MKYIDEFRDGALARQIAQRIAAEVRPGHAYRFMEFCGGHTHAYWSINSAAHAGFRCVTCFGERNRRASQRPWHRLQRDTKQHHL